MRSIITPILLLLALGTSSISAVWTFSQDCDKNGNPILMGLSRNGNCVYNSISSKYEYITCKWYQFGDYALYECYDAECQNCKLKYKGPLDKCYGNYKTTCHDEEPNYGKIFGTNAVGATYQMADKKCNSGVVTGRVVIAANRCVSTSPETSWFTRCDGSENVQWDYYPNGACNGSPKDNTTYIPDKCDEFGNSGYCAYY